ncbi:hypothetical protein Zmor_017446 [Zophobas morio]|uniref:Fatty acyl-CoA reductase n=1 Tax=Zophobas morio TaxID=2755281 RepID=A0AA38I906_9CUCU|nr:hypothetical protein Zmor_017446 [Zophobas morio]
MSSELSEIKHFYKNQTIFLTGGTGFLGKIILEKLLRECEGLSKVYMLIRPKKNKSSKQRLKELFDLPCFAVLKSKNVHALKKVCIVNGDCEEPVLGMSDEDIAVLKKETTCVIHASACVRFDQSLKKAALFVRATRDILELAKGMANLKAFVYVSTAFSNCVRLDIKEEFYEPPLTPEKFLAVVNSLDEDILDDISTRLLGNFPNTYVYSKNISEDLVRCAGESLPVAVVRPPIDTNCNVEPITGWADQFYGPFGLTTASTLGILRSVYIYDVPLEIVPLDYVVNCVISVLWKTSKSSKPTIYTIVPKKENVCTWYEARKLLFAHYLESPPLQMVWYYGLQFTPYKLRHDIYAFFLHTVVAYIADFALFCLGKPTGVVKIHERLAKQISSVEYFVTRHYHFHDNNTENLWNEMNEEDKELFNFDMKNMKWRDYLFKSFTGCNVYLLKESGEKISEAKRKMKILFVVHCATKVLLLYLLYKFVFFVLNRPLDLFTFSGPMGESDIDVTVVIGGWLERFVCDTWEVKEDCGVSDHNCILIGVEGVRGKFKSKIKKWRGWSMGNVNWEMFKSE